MCIRDRGDATKIPDVRETALPVPSGNAPNSPVNAIVKPKKKKAQNACSVVLAVHVHSPRRVREIRIAVVVLLLLSVLAVSRARATNRVLDHCIEPFVHASDSYATRSCAV